MDIAIFEFRIQTKTAGQSTAINAISKSDKCSVLFVLGMESIGFIYEQIVNLY